MMTRIIIWQTRPTKIMNLGWKPKIDLDKGLTETYSFFSKNYKKNNYK